MNMNTVKHYIRSSLILLLRECRRVPMQVTQRGRKHKFAYMIFPVNYYHCLKVWAVCLTGLFCFFLSNAVDAQVVYQVQHTSGTTVYGNTAVTVTPGTGTVLTSTNCHGGPYRIGYQTNAVRQYSYSISPAAEHIILKFAQCEDRDTINIYINGQHYALNYSNLSNVATTNCGNWCQTFMIDSNGDLVDTSTQIPYNHYGCGQVDIVCPNIQSVSFAQPLPGAAGGLGGAVVAFLFEEDTTTFIKQPYTDTVLCPGQTFPLVYNTNFRFQNNNTFTAQLSNASGSFASPVNIGSHADTTGDTIWCTIPANTAAGNGYRVRIVSSGPADTSLDNQVDIRVKAAPTAFSNSSNSPVCTGDSIQLLGSSSSSGVTWAWTGPNSFGSSAEDTGIGNAAMSHAGNYILTATLNSTGCSLSDTTTVVMRQTPNKPTAASNSPVCELDSLKLTSTTTTNGVSYSWSGPSYSSATQNPTVTGSAASTHAGNYISTVTINGCSNRDTTTVVVLPKPAKPTAAATNSPLCARQDLQLTASTVNGASYTWFGPAGYYNYTQNATRTYVQMNHGGAYYVYATVSGCISDTDSVVVVINTDPEVNIYPTPGTIICKDQQAIFTAIPTNGGTVGYDWRVNGATTGSTGVSYSTSSLNNGDVVTCLMASVGTCATPFLDTSNPILMTVQDTKAPKVSMTADAGPSLYPNEPINFTAVATDAGATPKYQWKRNGQDVGGATGAVWGANANFLSDGDDICVLVTSSYACPDPDTALSNCIKLNIRSGVADVDNDKDIHIYPNPTTGMLSITATEAIDRVEVSNLLGQHILMQTGTGKNMNIDMNTLAAGVYIIKVNGIYTERIIKE